VCKSPSRTALDGLFTAPVYVMDAGFATGASDYVIKPFSPRELMHRVNAVLERETG